MDLSLIAKKQSGPGLILMKETTTLSCKCAFASPVTKGLNKLIKTLYKFILPDFQGEYSSSMH